MSKIDIFVLAFLVFSAWLGFRHGVLRMAMALAGIFFSVGILRWKRDEMLQIFSSWNIQNSYILMLFMLGFILIITSVFVWISGWMEVFFKLVFLNWANKLAGLFLGIILGVLILSALLIAGTHIPREKPLISRSQLHRSVIGQIVLTVEQHTSLGRLFQKNIERTKEGIGGAVFENRPC